ncbi:T9SS type A sorting domain-containing protein [Aquimarina agarivorans]|uniref:T9SS type A sorting domain-containing protein n=1 Tax=Aquimarina agarivorans TaxID=980584 RepID=UPI000248EFF9|nr:T9SS type A sorting domain-containing protein [Aquimarina agarivorans]
MILENISVLGPNGEVIEAKELSRKRKRIDISKLSSGKYIIKIMKKGGTLVKQLIKK